MSQQAGLIFATMAWAFLPGFQTASAETSDPYPPISVSGQVSHSGILHLQDLQKLPQTTVFVSFVTAQGTESGSYSGPSLMAVLDAAGLVKAAGKNARLRHTIIISGSDDYAVAISLGEIDPDYEGKSVILATLKDGRALDPSDGIRLAVPGDRHGGRSVKQVVRLEVQ